MLKGNTFCISQTSLRDVLIKEQHTRALVGHTGRDNTIATLEERYFLPKLERDVIRFIQHYVICKTAKGTIHNTGLSSPLPIPLTIWKDINMDFILGFPNTPIRVDSVMITMDRYLKMAYFITYKKTIDASLVAQVFFKDVVQLHGVPKSIVLDKNVKFTGHFLEGVVKKI